MGRPLQHWLDILIVLTQKEIKIRYKNSILGYLWSIAHPLAFAFVFFIAFKVVMRINIENYTLFLIAGLFPWQWFSNSINSSPTILLGNASIIKKVNFPRSIILISSILNDAIHFLLSIPVIILFMLIYKKLPSFSWVYGLPALFIIQFFLIYGICLMVSSINLFFRDLERLIIILTTLLFYFTPIIYPETMIPEKYKNLLILNPIANLMVGWRNLFLSGSIESACIYLGLFYSLFFFSIGYIIFKKLSWKFAEVL